MGPGVYDVHSPVVPTVGWLADRIRSFLEVRRRGCAGPGRAPLPLPSRPSYSGGPSHRSLNPLPCPVRLLRRCCCAQVGLLEGDACRIHVNPDCGLKTRR